MKNALFSLATLFAITFGANAQDEVSGPGKGKLFVAGTVGYSSSTSKPNGGTSTTTGNLAFSPAVGFFLSENLAIGGRLQYSQALAEKQKGGTTFGFGVFGRYYKTAEVGGMKAALFGEANLGFSSATDQYPDGGTAPKPVNSFGFGVAPGVGIYPAKWGLEFTLPSLLGFTTSSQEIKITKGTTTTNFQSTITNFQLGVQTLSPAITIVYYLK